MSVRMNNFIFLRRNFLRGRWTRAQILVAVAIFVGLKFYHLYDTSAYVEYCQGFVDKFHIVICRYKLTLGVGSLKNGNTIRVTRFI